MIAPVDIPKITANITCINTVGNSQKSAVVPACTYSIADTSVAKIENGKILGIKKGETTLTVSALGTSTTIKITVSGEISAEPVTTIAGISLAIFENTAGDVVIHLDIPQGQENDTLLTIEQVNSNGQSVLKMHCPSFFLDLVQAGDTYNRYSTTFPIAITDMNNQLIITAYHGYDIVDTMVCTTSDYLTIVAKGNTKYSALATAMLNYATAAQNYFGTDVLHPTNAGLDAQYRNITVLPSNTFEGYNINGYASYNGADRVQGIVLQPSIAVYSHI